MSLISEFNSLLGFTHDELIKYFDIYVEKAAAALNFKKDEVYVRLEEYYGGYTFAIDSKETLYNPWSIWNFLYHPELGFKNYWFKSDGISSLIIQYLKIKNSFDFFDYKCRELYIDEYDLANVYEID